MDWTDRRVWITGASSGIGAALAAEFAGAGARLILSGRRADALAEVARACPDATVLPFEATDYDALPAIVDHAWDGGAVDLLVNNAGISQRSLALDTGFDVYRRLMEIDFFALLRLTQLVLPKMVARGGGHIAFNSSVAGKIGTPLRTGYSAVKHAVMGYADSLRAEVETAYGIKVSTITPGFVRTMIAANALTGDGSVKGHSGDDPVDTGMPLQDAVKVIFDGLSAGAHEIAVGGEMEMGALKLRAHDSETLFAMMAEQGRQLAASR